MKNEGLNILLVDDDALDRELVNEALLRTNIPYTLQEASDGEKAMNMLHTASAVPSFILLDLNMPVKDGREVLKEIRQDNKLKALPVVILSTSNAPFDIAEAYKHGANLFLVKPSLFSAMTEMLQSLLVLFGKYSSKAN